MAASGPTRSSTTTCVASPPGWPAAGVRIGDHVLIHAENCPEMVLAWLACAVVGAVAVTTNTKSVPHEIASFIARAPVAWAHHPTPLRRGCLGSLRLVAMDRGDRGQLG